MFRVFNFRVEPTWARSNWQSYCVRLPEGVDQKQVMQSLLNDGIATRRGIMCSHREPAYAKESWGAFGPLSESERAQDQCVLLPLFHQLTFEEQELHRFPAKGRPHDCSSRLIEEAFTGPGCIAPWPPRCTQ